LHTGPLSSLKRFKDDVSEVRAGFECGVGVEGFNDFEVGDTLEFFVRERES
jgi:translation initiation factor IF-2